MIPTWGDDRCQRIGLLGGSFNPAHCGHQAIARQALVMYSLDQVWLMVSPGNPLKERQMMASFERRYTSACQISDSRRIIPCDLEARWGIHYTVKTLAKLSVFFPRAHFLWLMGADGLCSLPRWYGWKSIIRQIPMAIFPRPFYNERALRCQAATYMQPWRVSPQIMRHFPVLKRPVWTYPLASEKNISATAIRSEGLWLPRNNP